MAPHTDRWPVVSVVVCAFDHLMGPAFGALSSPAVSSSRPAGHFSAVAAAAAQSQRRRHCVDRFAAP